MKSRIFILGLLLLMTSSVEAQIYFDLGIKGGFGGNLLLNGNVFDDEDLTHKFSTAYTVGGKFGLNFTMEHGLAIEAHYSGAGQDYEYNDFNDVGDANVRDRTMNYNGIDLLVLYKKSGAGQYVEIGGQYSILNTADYDDKNLNISAFDLLPGLNKNRLAAVLGFGSNIAGSEMTLVSLGLRVKYDFTDFFAEEINATEFYGKAYDEYKSSNPLSALLVLEFNQGIGYFAQRSCPKRVKYFNYD